MRTERVRTASLAAACLLLVASTAADDAHVPSLADVLARDFQVRTLDGGAVALQDLIGSGQPIVIEFWATWCAPCRKTLPHLIELENSHHENLLVLGLTVEDPIKDVSTVQEFVKEHGINFPIAFAPDELFQFMNDRPDIAVPKLFVFDAAGQLVAYIPRYSPFTPRKLESAVRKALGRK